MKERARLPLHPLSTQYAAADVSAPSAGPVLATSLPNTHQALLCPIGMKTFSITTFINRGKCFHHGQKGNQREEAGADSLKRTKDTEKTGTGCPRRISSTACQGRLSFLTAMEVTGGERLWQRGAAALPGQRALRLVCPSQRPGACGGRDTAG